jgi:predicted esterase
MQNGTLFTDVLAFAPINFMAPNAVGKPRLFFSAGRTDDVVTDASVQQMARQLKGMGYDVTVDINPAGHLVTDQGVKAAVARFLG